MKELSPEHAKQIIAKIRYMTIATVDEDNQPLEYAGGKLIMIKILTFTGLPLPKVNIQKNIEKNNKIFIVIYDSTAPSEEAWGVYMQAKAAKIENKITADTVAKLFTGDPYQHTEGRFYLDNYPRRIYKATPERFWMNDGEEIGDNYVDSRKEVDVV